MGVYLWTQISSISHGVFQKTGKKALIGRLAPLTRNSGFPAEGLFSHNEKYRSVILSIMGDEPILPVIQPVIQPVTIHTMLNNNGPNIDDGLNFVMCERSLKA